jgi:transcriptional regulator with XRE-family HTH domain
MDSRQCCAARALVAWSQSDLAQRAGLSRSAVSDFESGKRTPHAGNLNALQRAFEAQGVIFSAGGVTTADAVLDAYAAIVNPTAEQTAQAIVAAGVARRSGGRRRNEE